MDAAAAGRAWVALVLVAAAPAVTANLKVVGHVALDPGSVAGEVAVAGKTGVVAARPRDCSTPAVVSVVALAKPRSPRVVATIPLPAGVAATGVDLSETLLAVALDGAPGCGAASGGIAFYELADPSAPRALGRYCGDCATGQLSVSLARRADGRVLAVSAEAGTAAGVVRVVDATDPTSPVAVGSWAPPSPGSRLGCRPHAMPVSARFHDDGQRAVVADLDGGLYELDLADPSHPVEAGHFAYGADDEGDGASATAAELGDGVTVLLSDDDRDPATTSLRLDTGAAVPACERGPVTVAHQPDGRLSAGLVAAGRLCPGDPRPAALAGRIALIEANGGCSIADRLRRARDEGAAAVVISGDDTVSAGMDPDFPIPVVTVDPASVPRVRAADGTGATLADDPGAWGALRVITIDPANATAPTERRQLRSPAALAFPPPDRGVHAPGRAAISGDQAAVAWHADGLWVLDLSGNGAKTTGQFIPAAAAGSAAADVTGAAFLTDEIVAVDAQAGLFVLRRPAEGRATPLGEKLALAAGSLVMAVLVSLVALPRLAMAWALMRRGRGVPGRVRS